MRETKFLAQGYTSEIDGAEIWTEVWVRDIVLLLYRIITGIVSIRMIIKLKNHNHQHKVQITHCKMGALSTAPQFANTVLADDSYMLTIVARTSLGTCCTLPTSSWNIWHRYYCNENTGPFPFLQIIQKHGTL